MPATGGARSAEHWRRAHGNRPGQRAGGGGSTEGDGLPVVTGDRFQRVPRRPPGEAAPRRGPRRRRLDGTWTLARRIYRVDLSAPPMLLWARHIQGATPGGLPITALLHVAAQRRESLTHV